MGCVFGAAVGALLFWFFSNYIPLGSYVPPRPDRVERPKPTPSPRPPGPFGTQTFPIYPTPGDPDFEQRHGIPACQCVRPKRGPAVRGPGFLLDSCACCGLPISLSRPMPEAAFVDGHACPSLVGWIMPGGGDPPDAAPRPVWGAR